MHYSKASPLQATIARKPKHTFFNPANPEGKAIRYIVLVLYSMFSNFFSKKKLASLCVSICTETPQETSKPNYSKFQIGILTLVFKDNRLVINILGFQNRYFMAGNNLNNSIIGKYIFNAREQCMEAALTDALNWLETGGGDVVSDQVFDSYY